jgi:S-methylmethionine-dependent homocysteine/selenocysteine methylase
MRTFLARHDLVLMEAAVVERLRRDGRAELHPRLVLAPLVHDERGRRELQRIYESYVTVAEEAGLPLLLCAPTWRANRERVGESGVDRDINGDAVRFMSTVRSTFGGGATTIKVGGVIGCKHDCYRPEEGLSGEESEKFHSWQVSRLAGAGVDFLVAETLPCIQEAVGIARAMAATEVPYLISFVIRRDGRVLDGTPLSKAIDIVDDAVRSRPLGFMVNCAHPSFLCAAEQPRRLFERLIGYQGNASPLDHADLDGLSRLDVGDVSQWGDEMLALNQQYGIKILGGCCGTGVDHLEYLVSHWRR